MFHLDVRGRKASKIAVSEKGVSVRWRVAECAV